MALDLWLIDRNEGLNERGQPSPVESTQVLQSLNTSWMTEGVLCLRRGSKAQSLTSSGFTGPMKWVATHITNAGVEELWANANNAGTAALARRSAGTWSAVTYSDTVVVADLLYHHSATLNGKHFICYNSDVNRLHVWDGTVLRRVGITKPAALTVANGGGAGAYPATARFYRTAQRIKSGSDIIAQSELSDAVSFTPSGADTNATITKSTTIDSATHWVVYGLLGSVGDVYDLYEEIAEIVVGTTTYADTANPALYSGDAPPELGINVPPPSAKFIVADADGGRLVMAGAWETSASAGQTAPLPNGVWWTRRLGTSDQGDEESIPNSVTYSYVMRVGDAGPVTGLAGPIFGEFYVFKSKLVGKLVPTGDEVTPYRYVPISTTCGALDQRAIAQIGNTGVAFADATTVYLASSTSQPTPMSDPISLTLSFTPLASTAWLAYDQWSQRLMVFQAEASETGYWFDTVKLRWGTVAWSGQFNRAVTAIQDDGGQRLISVGDNGVADASLMVAFGHTLPADNSVEFVGTVRVRRVLAPGSVCELFAPTIFYRAPDATATLTLTVRYTRQDGVTLGSGNITLTPTSTNANASGTSYSVNTHTVDVMGMADVTVADVTVTLLQTGGAGSITSSPTIDLIVVPYKVQGPLGR